MNADADRYERYHVPVLGAEAASLLITKPDGIYIDGTMGGGGHTRHILAQVGPDARVIGVDQDEEAVARCRAQFASDGRVTVVKDNFSRIRSIIRQLNMTIVDGVLLDLGVSSHQIDTAARGFSHRFDGLLDMRMDTGRAVRAADILNTMTADELTRLFFEYGEERRSRRIARVIVQAREGGPLRTTGQLADIISRVVPEQERVKTLSRIFQAIRMKVNDELEHLRAAMRESLEALRPGGRIVVISYHSLEDRLVKTFFREQARSCICPPRTPMCVCGNVATLVLLTTKPIVPGSDEIAQNPRARSAKLRAARKIV